MKNSKAKRFLVNIYEKFFELRRMLILRIKYRLRIMSPYKTIKYIKKHQCSIARYGDGEFNLMLKFSGPHFQDTNYELSQKLMQTLQNNNKNLLLCMPRCMNTLRNTNAYAKKFWKNWGKNNLQIETVSFIRNKSGKHYCFGDSQITRPYIDWKTDKRAKRTFPLLKSLWKNKKILIVEGELTRLGVGNDLFDDCASIKRILAPATNAFDYYDEIKQAVLNHYKDELIIIALGPTATILAADLSNMNIQCLDIGHIDLEYEWFLRGVKEKTAIIGKYTNESKDGRVRSICNDTKYNSQIIERIGC